MDFTPSPNGPRWKVSDKLERAGESALQAGALVGGGIALAAIGAMLAPFVATVAVFEKLDAAWQKRLSRVVFERLDRIERAADSAGLSREDVAVGVAQKYVYESGFGPYGKTENFNASLAKLDQWREERSGQRRGLWISKESERAALAKIASKKAG